MSRIRKIRMFITPEIANRQNLISADVFRKAALLQLAVTHFVLANAEESARWLNATEPIHTRDLTCEELQWMFLGVGTYARTLKLWVRESRRVEISLLPLAILGGIAFRVRFLGQGKQQGESSGQSVQQPDKSPREIMIYIRADGSEILTYVSRLD